MISRALGLFVRDRDPRELFSQLLDDVLSLTGSEYGYLAEVLYDEAEQPYLRTWAITDISWDAATSALYREFVTEGGGLEFTNLETLFGWGLLEGGRVVLANDRPNDPRSSGIPAGHPHLDRYLAIPVLRQGALIGQIAVANREAPYDEALVDLLEPFTQVVGNVIEALRADRERREAEEALASSDRRMAAIVARLSDIVTILDTDGSWQFSSPAGSRLLGWPTGYDPENGVFSLLHPDDVEVAWKALDEVLNGRRGPTEPVELRVRTATGDYRLLETVGEDLGGDPAVRGVVLTSHDITARKLAEVRLNETSAELRSLVAALSDAVLFVVKDEVVFANDALVELFSLTASSEELHEGSVRALCARMGEATADADAFDASTMEAVMGRVARTGVQFTLADGRTVERDFLPVPLDGDRQGNLWLYRDITERVERDLHRQRMLDSEREMRTAIEEQVNSLRALDELKNEFVATVSHELRTPLTSIVSFSELLAGEIGPLGEEPAEFLGIIQRNAQRLLGLVGDLLLVARLESGTLPMHPRPLSASSLLGAVVESARLSADGAGLRLELEIESSPAPLIADESRMDQVLSNLVANAIKFTPAGGVITVSAHREDVAWVLAVRDTGIGIPAGEVDQLCQRFYRASNVRPTDHPGTGLGLAISLAIVEFHGGTMRISSREGAGTTVYVTLPDGGADAHD